VSHFKQVVKVIWHKAASPPLTNGSVVFARWRQCAPPSSTPQLASAPCRHCALLSRFAFIYSRKYPDKSWVGPFRPQNCSFTRGDLGPHLIHDSLLPLESTSRTESRSVQPFCRTHSRDRQSDRQTDHAAPSVVIGRIVIAATRPKM